MTKVMRIMNKNNDNNKNRSNISAPESDFIDKETFHGADEPLPEVTAREKRRRSRQERMKRKRTEVEKRLKEELSAQKKLADKNKAENEKTADDGPERQEVEIVIQAPSDPVKEDKTEKEEPAESIDAEKDPEAVDEAHQDEENESETVDDTAEDAEEKSLEDKKLEKKRQKAQIKKNREKIVLIKHETVEDDEDDYDVFDEDEASAVEPVSDDEEIEEKEEKPKKKKKKQDGEKSGKAKVTDIRTARKKQKMKRRLKVLIALLIVVSFGLGVYLSRGYWVPKLEGILDRPHATIINDGKTVSGNFPITFDETAVNTISAFNDCIIKVDDNHIYFYDEAGEEISSLSHSFANPVVKTAGKRALVYDSGGNKLSVMNKKGELFTKEIEDPILLAQIGNNSNVAVVTQNDKYEAVMTVYDADGTLIYKWQSYKKVVDITFDDKGDGCFVTTFKSKNGLICSYLTYLKFDSEDEQMQSGVINDLVLDTMMNDNEDYWVVGAENFYKLDKDGNVLFTYEYNGQLIDFTLNKASAAVVVEGVGKGNGVLTIFRADSDSDNPNSVIYTEGGSPKKLHSSNGMTFLLKENSIDAYDKAGNLLATANVSSDYIDFAYLNDAVYFLDVRELNKISFKT
ncbi:MAG: hypothetical protein IJH80_03100 [Ruminococcus sp.]|nr:hypothetical protein [Ruminococcus sp.]